MQYGYDQAGRQTSATDPLEPVMQMRYDAVGQVVGITDHNGPAAGLNAQ